MFGNIRKRFLHDPEDGGLDVVGQRIEAVRAVEIDLYARAAFPVG